MTREESSGTRKKLEKTQKKLEKNSKKLEKDFGELDCISREQALKELKESAEHHANDSREEVLLRRDRDIIRALPSVTPQEPQSFKWCTDCKEYDQEKHCCHRWSKVIRDTVEEMKQEPRWIPCSERLPEDSGEYFVTVIDEDVETYKHTGIAWYAHPKDYDVEEGDWRELMIDEKVIAWMPLHAPFEPQESEGV